MRRIKFYRHELKWFRIMKDNDTQADGWKRTWIEIPFFGMMFAKAS